MAYIGFHWLYNLVILYLFINSLLYRLQLYKVQKQVLITKNRKVLAITSTAMHKSNIKVALYTELGLDQYSCLASHAPCMD
jgi:hypothetical protein